MASAIDGTVALFVTNFLPYSQTFIFDEIRAHRRYDVDVFCKARLNDDRFPYERIHKPPNRIAERLYENLAYWPRFDRILAQGRHDLIHAHFGTGAVYALPYVRKYELPFVVTFWGNDVAALIGSQRRRPKRWRYVSRAPQILQRADLMLCQNQEFCDILSRLSGRPEAVRLYRQGVDLSRFKPSPARLGTPQIIMIGRFTEKKGHEVALRAFAQIKRLGREAHLTLIGTGELEAKCRRYVQTANLERDVTFSGVLSHTRTAEMLAVSDVAIVPSLTARNDDREGGPMVVMEAAAAGLPVVGTYHGGIPDAVEDRVTGFLVPEGDVEALANSLIALLDDPELRLRMGRAARLKMEREFDLFKQVELLESHYDSVR
ncbi:MAG TPA: glycosyltransferase [Rhodothermales bacterium]|nr:glycosyltransferase [Rhodothermales bacterium]